MIHVAANGTLCEPLYDEPFNFPSYLLIASETISVKSLS